MTPRLPPMRDPGPGPSIEAERSAIPGSGGRRRGILLVMLAGLAWSTGGLIVRSVSTDSWTTIFWRSFFAAAALLLFVVVQNGRETVGLFRRMGWAGLLMATCFATASASFVAALQWTSVANALLLQGLSPFVAAILGLVFMRERVAPRTWIAMVLAMGGAAIMVSDSLGRGSLAGDLLGVLVAIGLGGTTVVVRYNREVHMTPAACLAALLAGAAALAMGASPASASRVDIGFLALFGCGQFALGLIFYTLGARLIPAAESALLGYVEIVLGAFWVWLVYAEDPGTRTLIGGSVILACLVGLVAADLRRDPARARSRVRDRER